MPCLRPDPGLWPRERERTHFCCVKTPSLWSFATAVPESSHRRDCRGLKPAGRGLSRITFPSKFQLWAFSLVPPDCPAAPGTGIGVGCVGQGAFRVQDHLPWATPRQRPGNARATPAHGVCPRWSPARRGTQGSTWGAARLCVSSAAGGGGPEAPGALLSALEASHLNQNRSWEWCSTRHPEAGLSPGGWGRGAPFTDHSP